MFRSASRIAVTVMGLGSGLAPCLFFGKCDGIMVVDVRTGLHEFRGNPTRTPKSLCDLILASGVGGLICCFIPEPEIVRLRTAGVDVRAGSCRCTVDGLVACFSDLPQALRLRPTNAVVGFVL